jgi:hypothetical protein
MAGLLTPIPAAQAIAPAGTALYTMYITRISCVRWDSDPYPCVQISAVYNATQFMNEDSSVSISFIRNRRQYKVYPLKDVYYSGTNRMAIRYLFPADLTGHFTAELSAYRSGKWDCSIYYESSCVWREGTSVTKTYTFFIKKPVKRQIVVYPNK